MQKLWLKLRSSLPLALAALFATFAVLTIPNYPYLITDALSEKAVLSYAHQKGWCFGTDLVFTYGPLGFLSSRYYFAPAAGLRTIVDLLFCFMVSAGIVRVAGRMNRVARWSLIGAFIFLTANIDPRYDLLLYLGIFSWGLLCLIESGQWFGLAAACFVLLAAFGILVKANFVFASGLGLVAICGDLALRRKYRAPLAVVTGFIMVFFAGWFASGQTVANLIPFFARLIPIVKGYNSAVGFDGLQILRSRGVLTAVLVLLIVVVRSLLAFDPAAGYPGVTSSNEKDAAKDKHEPGITQSVPSTGSRPDEWFARWPRRVLLVSWLLGLLLMTWKHGFVRADLFHMGFFFGFVPVLGIALEVLPSKSSAARTCARGLTAFCALVVIFTLVAWSFPSLSSSVGQPFRSAAINLRALFSPSAYRGQMLEVKVGADNVEYALLEGDCLVIRHETEQIQLTPEHPVAVRPVSKWYGKA